MQNLFIIFFHKSFYEDIRKIPIMFSKQKTGRPMSWVFIPHAANAVL